MLRFMSVKGTLSASFCLTRSSTTVLVAIEGRSGDESVGSLRELPLTTSTLALALYERGTLSTMKSDSAMSAANTPMTSQR